MLSQLGRFLAARRGDQRMAVEVDKVEPEAAPHHAMRGHRRIDSAGEQRHSMTRDADGQAARARLFAGSNVGGVGKDFDRDDQRRILKIYFKSESILYRSSD